MLLNDAALQPILAGFPSVGGVDWLRETTGHFEAFIAWLVLCQIALLDSFWDVMPFLTRVGEAQSAESLTAE